MSMIRLCFTSREIPSSSLCWAPITSAYIDFVDMLHTTQKKKTMVILLQIIIYRIEMR